MSVPSTFSQTETIAIGVVALLFGITLTLGTVVVSGRTYSRGVLDHAQGRVTVVTNITNTITYSVKELPERVGP